MHAMHNIEQIRTDQCAPTGDPTIIALVRTFTHVSLSIMSYRYCSHSARRVTKRYVVHLHPVQKGSATTAKTGN